MRILYLCHRVPYPPNKGEKIRAFNQLRAIAARHEVDLFTLADKEEDLRHEAALLQYCRRVTITQVIPTLARLRSLPYLFTSAPLTVPYFRSVDLRGRVRKALSAHGPYDRIFVYSSAMAQYVDGANRIPVVIDLVDVDSDKWKQYADLKTFPLSYIYGREARCLRAYERKICERASCVFVSTEREARLLQQITSAARVHVISNGVDTAYFDPSLTSEKRSLPTVTFTGDMGYFPNEEAVIFFADKVLPQIRRSVPNVRFLIVGRNPTRKVLRLREKEGIEVTGLVPDIRAYLAQTHVSVAPFTVAAGIQNKILEALAYGLPVVATSRTVQGLSAAVAEIVETGNSSEELATKIVRLLRDPELARQKGSEGRRKVASEYSWKQSLDRMLQLLDDAPDRLYTDGSSTGSNKTLVPFAK